MSTSSSRWWGATGMRGVKLTRSSSLLSAALGIARTAVYNDDDMNTQRSILSELALMVPLLKPHLKDLQHRLSIDHPDMEIGQIRRARLLLNVHSGVVDLAADLVAAVTQPAVNAVRVTADLYVAEGKGQRVRTVLLAAREVRDNVERMEMFFNEVRQFCEGKRIGRNVPILSIAMVGGGEWKQFDRIRDRIAMRLVNLNTCMLGYVEEFWGKVEAEFSYGCIKDAGFVKRLVSKEVSDGVAQCVKRGVLSRAFMQGVGEVLKACVGSGGTTRFLCLSWASWSGGGDTVSTGIRKVNWDGVEGVEMRMDLFEDWDYAMARQVLVEGVSMGVLVFRFEFIDELKRMIGVSRVVTDQFVGLTGGGRILYVGKDVDWEDVAEVVVERRLLEPKLEEVIEEEEEGWREVVVERVLSVPSLIHMELEGKGLEGIVQVVNRETGFDEMNEESEDVVEMLQKLKSFVHTKVSDRKDCVIVCRSDATGYATLGGKVERLLRVGEYRDWRDVTETQPVTVEARVLGVQRQGGKRWGIVKRLEEEVRQGKLVLAVADERKTCLERKGVGYVTAVYLTICGGGEEEWLHAKMIRNCVEAVREDEGTEVVRALLRLVPGLGAAAYNLRDSYGVPWDLRR